MFSILHNINYRKNLHKSLTLNVFIILLLSFTPKKTLSQNFINLPALDSLLSSVDTFYNNLSIAQIEELKQSTKYRWLNYLPSPGYSPFTGGFTLSVNISGPLSEIKTRHTSKQKTASIIQLNKIVATDLKNSIIADYESLHISIFEFHSKDTLDYLTIEAFNLSKSQYKRNEITPTEFFSSQKNYQSWQVQRLIEGNTINKAILQLFIKSKAAITTNDYGFKNVNNNDKITTAK